MSDGFNATAFLKTVSSAPGVYRMYDANDLVIYVGKAKDLKKDSLLILGKTSPM